MIRWTLAVCLAILASPHVTEATEALPSLNVDLDETSVSGLSSGAYMAGQFHIAFSDNLTGAAVIAGGPFGCSKGQLALALNQCMQTTLLGAPDPEALFGQAQQLAEDGRIDPLANLQDDRVYIFSGTKDDTVTQAVADQTAAFYRLAGLPETAIRYVDDLPAGHAFITEEEGAAGSRPERPTDRVRSGRVFAQFQEPRYERHRLRLRSRRLCCRRSLPRAYFLSRL